MGGVGAAQREDFQREEGPSRGASGKERSNKQPLPEIRGCQRGRGCANETWWTEGGGASPPAHGHGTIAGPPSKPVPSGHLGTLRPREVRASQRGGPAISATQPGTFKQGHSVLGKKLGVSHQGWLRSLMGGGPPRGGHKGFLRVFCTMKPEKEEEPAICLSKTLGLGRGGCCEVHTGSLSSQAGSAGEQRTSTQAQAAAWLGGLRQVTSLL